jgi:hypothetical protein
VVRAPNAWLLTPSSEQNTQVLKDEADPNVIRDYQDGYGEQVIEPQVIGTDLKP